MTRNIFFLCLGFLVSFRCTIVQLHDINVKHCFIFTRQQPFWVSFLPLISVKVLLYHLKAKRDAEIQVEKDVEIQAKKVAKIQAKKVAKIQAKMDAEIQGKKNAEIQLLCLNFSIHFWIGMLHKYLRK